jgi:outer membrane protein OmpA-like peptidoglycan-associated protein
VKVLTVDGKTELGHGKTNANGDYSISVAQVPKTKKVWVKYELEGWERKPANYAPVKLETDVNHHNAQLSPKNMSDEEAASFGKRLRTAELAGEDVQEAQAIASRLPPQTRARIAEGYAASFASEKQKETMDLAMKSFDAAYERYGLRQQIAELEARIEEIAFVRYRPDGKVALTLYDSYFDAGKKDVSKDKKEEYDLVAAWLVAANPSSVSVEGHADATGPADANSNLAKLRAESVRRILVEGGVLPSSVKAIGMGEANDAHHPGANATAYYNRRVDVIVSIDKNLKSF